VNLFWLANIKFLSFWNRDSPEVDMNLVSKVFVEMDRVGRVVFEIWSISLFPELVVCGNFIMKSLEGVSNLEHKTMSFDFWGFLARNC